MQHLNLNGYGRLSNQHWDGDSEWRESFTDWHSPIWLEMVSAWLTRLSHDSIVIAKKSLGRGYNDISQMFQGNVSTVDFNVNISTFDNLRAFLLSVFGEWNTNIVIVEKKGQVKVEITSLTKYLSVTSWG